MTMKHQERNISAENEEVFIGASLSTEGILTFNKKNFYDETTGTFIINLNKIKLRLIPLENKQQLDAIKNSNDPDIIEQRNSHIYLVPFSEQDVEEGIYRECVWVESKHDFEVLGSTKVDLEPIQLDISRLKNILGFEIVEENGTVTIKSNRLDDIEDELDRLEEVKVDKVPGKQLSTEDYTTAEKNKLAGIENEANKYIHPSYAAKTGKPTANQTPGFGGNVTISQITSDNKGHVTGAVDRIITIPSTPASATTNGLAKATSTNPSDVNLSSNNVGTNNNEFARADHVHKHPTGVSKTGQPTSNQTPGFGDTFKVTQFTSNATGHISGATDRNITIPATEATTSIHGLMSASDKTKLDGIAPGAGHLTIDSALNENSTNPVQNAVICREFYTKEDIINLLNSIETGRGKLLTIYVDETTGDLVIQDNGLEYYTEDEVDDLFLTKTDANTQYTIGLEKQGTADTGDISTYVVKQGGTSLSPKIKIPKNLSQYTNDIGFLTQHQSLANYIQKSNTNGLVKNDGTIDTNTYLTQHQDISGKQNTLVSGTNIKTINNESILGSGNISIQSSSDIATSWGNPTTDTKVPSEKLVKTELNKKIDKVTGKGLSTHDFSDFYKSKLDKLSLFTLTDTTLMNQQNVSCFDPTDTEYTHTYTDNKTEANFIALYSPTFTTFEAILKNTLDTVNYSYDKIFIRFVVPQTWSSETYREYIYINNTLIKIPNKVSELVNDSNFVNSTTLSDSLAGKINKSSIVDNLTTGSIERPLSARQGVVISALLDNKVDKVSGKGLSTNDFTNAYKSQLDGLISNSNWMGLDTQDILSHLFEKEVISENDLESYEANPTLANFNQVFGSVESVLRLYIDEEYSDTSNFMVVLYNTDWGNDYYEFYAYISYELVKIPTKTSDLTNDSNFLTEHQTLPTIVDNLTTNDATKVLSAKQGKVLKDLIGDAISYINQGGSS